MRQRRIFAGEFAVYRRAAFAWTFGKRVFNFGWRKLHPFAEKPAGDETRGLDQKAVDALYAQIYAKIAQAKEHANSRGKKLVILLGEDHRYAHSLLQNLLIADIAARIGINVALLETDAANLEQTTKQSQQHWQEARKLNQALLNHDVRVPDDNICQSEFELLRDYGGLTAQDKKDVDRVATILRIANSLTPEKAGHHSEILKEFQRANQSHLLVGDPLAALILDRLDWTLEAAMADTVKGVAEHRIACYGYWHLPVLYDHLIKDTSIDLLAFNTSNVKTQGAPQYRLRKRFRLLDQLQLGPEPSIVCLRIDGAPPSRTTAYKIAMQASLHHRETAKGIGDPLTSEKAARLRRLMEAVYEDCALK